MKAWAKILCAALLATGLAAGLAAAQDTVLHERVPDVTADEGLVWSSSADAEPSAIVYDGQILPAPAGGGLRADERPMVASPGDGSAREQPGRRSPTFSPDRVTALEGTLRYFTVFTPSIAPFKRVTALDTVVVGRDGRTPVLGVGNVRTRTVSVVGVDAPAPDTRPRDRFWGSVVLDFAGGRRVPLPSVSPESRFLTVRTEPNAMVAIERDGADNFFAVAIGRLPALSIRLTFLTDAPRSYFGTEIPDARTDALADFASELPRAVRRHARRFTRELGLSRDLPLRHSLEVLTAHFRSFEEAHRPTANTGDIYLDLARSMKGVCRHRSYAFVITALGLGIPARFVMNEAHAWVEVRMPSVGWMRIDLGGAATGLDARQPDDRPAYRPESPDPLPKPEAYLQSYSRAAEAAARRRRERRAPRPRSRAQRARANRTARQAGEGAGAASGPGRSPGPDRTRAARARVLRLSVVPGDPAVFRGRSLAVSGRAVAADGTSAPGLRIEIYLQGTRTHLLGVTVTDAEGRYAGSFGIAHDLPVGDYHLRVSTPGDARFDGAETP